MAAINVTCEVREYPDNEKSYRTMKIRNHWNYPEKVEIEIGGMVYTFRAADIKKALDNAINAH